MKDYVEGTKVSLVIDECTYTGTVCGVGNRMGDLIVWYLIRLDKPIPNYNYTVISFPTGSDLKLLNKVEE